MLNSGEVSYQEVMGTEQLIFLYRIRKIALGSMPWHKTLQKRMNIFRTINWENLVVCFIQKQMKAVGNRCIVYTFLSDIKPRCRTVGKVWFY
nr:MAG TPA: hypothetical protein [Caudoviricetes sp.]